VIAMRAYWILPNRGQKDDLLASDGEKIIPFRQILDPKLRPKGFSHGVPAELLEKSGPQAFAEILFAQRFPAWDGDRQLFSVSTPAGLDSSGRVVHLGLLFLLEPYERPQFELAYASLSKEDRPYAKGLIHRIAAHGGGDLWAQSVRDLSELRSGRRPATNVELDRSVVPFDSLYVAGLGGLTRKTASWRKSRMTAILFLILFAVVGLGLSLRSCERSSRSAVQAGMVPWHFN
jgi:hypothetical protein